MIDFDKMEKEVQKEYFKKYSVILCKIEVPYKPNFVVGNPTRYIKRVKRLLIYKDMFWDKQNKIYLTRVTGIPSENQYRFIDMLDKDNPFYYAGLRRGYIMAVEFNISQAGHDIIVKGII